VIIRSVVSRLRKTRAQDATAQGNSVRDDSARYYSEPGNRGLTYPSPDCPILGCTRTLALLACIWLAQATPGAAQQEAVKEVAEKDLSGPPIVLTHVVPSVSEIPPVGSLMRLQVSLRNTTDIEAKIRLVGSKDGRFIDIAFPRGALNSADHPTFTTEIPSPVAAMTYQFILHQRDGTLSASQRYVLKRGCIQNFTVDVPDEGGTAAYRREMATLVAKANRLDRDNKSLEASLKLLEEMKTSLSR
jgi:hypothetical protein